MSSEPTAPQSVDYQVWCHSCKTSFARGTRRCIHCGERIGRASREFPELAGFTDEAEAGDAEEVEASPGRAMLWVMTAVLALVGTLMRLCGG